MRRRENLCQFMLHHTNLILLYSERAHARGVKMEDWNWIFCTKKKIGYEMKIVSLKNEKVSKKCVFTCVCYRKGFKLHFSNSPIFFGCLVVVAICENVGKKHENLISFSLSTEEGVEMELSTYFWNNISWLESHKCTSRREWEKLRGIQQLCQVSNSTQAALHTRMEYGKEAKWHPTGNCSGIEGMRSGGRKRESREGILSESEWNFLWFGNVFTRIMDFWFIFYFFENLN